LGKFGCSSVLCWTVGVASNFQNGAGQKGISELDFSPKDDGPWVVSWAKQGIQVFGTLPPSSPHECGMKCQCFREVVKISAIAALVVSHWCTTIPNCRF
jgi:hypothetical protein